MKVGFSLALVAALSGCASSTSQYYEAVQAAAQANAAASQAKYDALAAIASSGDGQAASAAVMALALTQTPTITPVPQQSQALQWASILATPVTSLGMMWMQADSAKTMAKYSADVDLARISADATTQQSLYGSFVSMGEVAGNIDYTPFVNGMVDLGTAGINGAVNLGTAGFDSNVALGTAGINGAVTLGTAGFDSNVALGTAGIDGAVNLGNAGITGVAEIGAAGIAGITNVSTTAFGTLLSLDAGNNALMDGVWADYTTAIAEIMKNVPQLKCTVVNNADGTSSVNCTP